MGDPAEELVATARKCARRYCERCRRAQECMEDVPQNAAMIFLQKYSPRKDSRKESLSLVCVIARNEARRYCRKKRPDDGLDGDSQRGRDDTAERDTILKEAFDRLRTVCLKQLPEREREAVKLTYAEGLTLADIAIRLACSIATVSNLLKAAKEKLRKCLKDHIGGEDLP